MKTTSGQRETTVCLGALGPTGSLPSDSTLNSNCTHFKLKPQLSQLMEGVSIGVHPEKNFFRNSTDLLVSSGYWDVSPICLAGTSTTSSTLHSVCAPGRHPAPRSAFEPFSAKKLWLCQRVPPTPWELACRRCARQSMDGFCLETPRWTLPPTAPASAARDFRESDWCAKLARDSGLTFLLTCTVSGG